MTNRLPPKDKPTDAIEATWLRLRDRCGENHEGMILLTKQDLLAAMNAARTPITSGGGDATEWLPTFSAFVAELDNHEAVTIDCDSVMHMVLRCAVAALTAKLNSEALVGALRKPVQEAVWFLRAQGGLEFATALADAFNALAERGERP